MAGPGAAPRAAAFGVLRDVSAGAYADRSATTRFAALSPPDRRLAQELAYGAIRLRARLDTELASLANRPLDQLDADVLDALRLGLYQLRETRVPAHAAVNATLEAVRGSVRSGPRGLLNAVLRRAAREGRDEALFPSMDDDPAGHLATWGSHPEWLVRRWLERWPLAHVRRLVENDNSPPPVTLRLPGDDLAAQDPGRLAAMGLRPVRGHPGMVRLESGEPGAALEALGAIAQDPAASSVVDYVGRSCEAPLLDACAAPGGKTLGLWIGTSARPIVASDRSAERLLRLAEAARRLGARPLMLVMDAARPAVRAMRTVLLDAPCSGTGVLRRRPDARWRLTPAKIESLVTLQGQLLDAMAGLVVPGGSLVYATCSLEPEENEEQVARFLAAHREFERDAEGGAGGSDLFTAPWDDGFDGAFASRLRRKRNG